MYAKFNESRVTDMPTPDHANDFARLARSPYAVRGETSNSGPSLNDTLVGLRVAADASTAAVSDAPDDEISEAGRKTRELRRNAGIIGLHDQSDG